MKECKTCKVAKPLNDYYKDTGMPDGHRSNCKPCKNAKTMEWRAANRESYNSAQRVQHKKNYARNRLYRYKLTPEQYQAMLTEQDGRCAICQRPPQGKRPLAIDHCHKTGKVRGLLCYGCNRALHILDTPLLLSIATSYIEKRR